MKVNNLEEEIRDLSDQDLKDYFMKKGYEFVWHQSLDVVEIGRLGDITLTRDKLIEARIFGGNKEIHVFRYDGDFIATECCGEDSDLNVYGIENIPRNHERTHYYDETQFLSEKYGKNIVFRNFIGYEDDGQAFICNKIILGCK